MTEIELLERKFRISKEQFTIYMVVDDKYKITFLNKIGNEQFIFKESKMEVVEEIIKLMMEGILFVKSLKSKEGLLEVLPR